MGMTIDEAIEHGKEQLEIFGGEHKEFIEYAIKALEQEPKTGHWKPFDLTYGRSIYYCTACRESEELPTYEGEPLYKYCPNCGAKMETEDKNA